MPHCMSEWAARHRAYLVKQLGKEAAAKSNSAGDTPLHTAAKCGFAGICSILIEAGADLSPANAAG